MSNKPCSGQQHIHCQNCSISELCLPFTLNDKELDTLDSIIDRKRPIHKGEQIFNDGQAMHALYAIRSGTFKTYTVCILYSFYSTITTMRTTKKF